MTARIYRLYPGPPEDVALEGTYLSHKLHALGSAGKPFVYASFVSSLDGRIALQDPGTGVSHLPAGLTSANDFRLFLELQAQADCLITHSGYLRDLAAGRLDDVLQVGTRDSTRDLARWRDENGLPPQPAVVIASSSLDFPIPGSLALHGQRVIIAAGAAAPAEKIERLRADGYRVIIAGTGTAVEGAPLVRELGGLGFRSLYLLSGPRMLETMLRDGMLSRLYVTITHSILGGERFHTMISGPELGDAGRLRMFSLHYDATAPQGAGQWFAHFEPVRAESKPEGAMDTANVNDPASVETVYSRADFEQDARLNAQDKATIQHGIAILSAPDSGGAFSLMRAKRHVGEVQEPTRSIFLGPSLKTSEYGAFIQDDTGYGGPVERRDPPEEPADPYRSFVEEIFQAVRSAQFPPAVPAERLKGFHGG